MIHSLNFVRVFGFVLVLLHHLQHPLIFFQANGWIGMDLLFALSAFLATHSIQRTAKLNWIRFYSNRFLRIAPLTFLYLFAMGPLDCIWPYLLFVGNWHIMFYGWSPVANLGHLWSLAMQEQVLCFVPLLVLIPKPSQATFLVLIALASWNLKFVFFDPVNYFSIYMNTLVRLEPFCVGAFIACIYNQDQATLKKEWVLRCALTIFGIGLVMFSTVSIREQDVWTTTIGYGLSSLWCGACMILFVNFFEIQSKSAAFFSSICLGMYLFHPVCIQLSWRFCEERYLRYGITLGLTLLIASAAYFLIELPVNQFLRSRLAMRSG